MQAQFQELYKESIPGEGAYSTCLLEKQVCAMNRQFAQLELVWSPPETLLQVLEWRVMPTAWEMTAQRSIVAGCPESPPKKEGGKREDDELLLVFLFLISKVLLKSTDELQ